VVLHLRGSLATSREYVPAELPEESTSGQRMRHTTIREDVEEALERPSGPSPASDSGRLQAPLLASTTTSTSVATAAAGTAAASRLQTPLLVPPVDSGIDRPHATSGSLPSLRKQMTSGTQSTLEGLERLNRLTTDLANERTLLAWIRTCLASMRTLFAYYGLGTDSDAWFPVLISAEMCMATITFVTAALGGWRYLRIKAVVAQKIPPRDFGRLTLRPLMGLLLLVASVTALGSYMQVWKREGSNAS